MRVWILGSGSRGNAIGISTGTTSILIDAGFSLRSLRRRAKASGFPLQELAAIVVTHEHNDHAGGVAALAATVRCPVYASRGTLEALRCDLAGATTIALEMERPVRVGSFEIHACRTLHDASEPVALTVQQVGREERIGIAYDIGTPTDALRRFLRGMTALIIEANHDADLLRTGPYPASVRSRIAGRYGHLSNQSSGELAAQLAHPKLDTVALVHLSEQCNRPELALTAVREVMGCSGFRGRMLVAPQDRPATPFDVGPCAGQLALALES